MPEIHGHGMIGSGYLQEFNCLKMTTMLKCSWFTLWQTMHLFYRTFHCLYGWCHSWL